MCVCCFVVLVVANAPSFAFSLFPFPSQRFCSSVLVQASCELSPPSLCLCLSLCLSLCLFVSSPFCPCPSLCRLFCAFSSAVHHCLSPLCRCGHRPICACMCGLCVCVRVCVYV